MNSINVQIGLLKVSVEQIEGKWLSFAGNHVDNVDIDQVDIISLPSQNNHYF